jgi:hypothetical protein
VGDLRGHEVGFSVARPPSFEASPATMRSGFGRRSFLVADRVIPGRFSRPDSGVRLGLVAINGLMFTSFFCAQESVAEMRPAPVCSDSQIDGPTPGLRTAQSGSEWPPHSRPQPLVL